LIVLVAVISPFEADRQRARSLFEEGEFLEVFVDTPVNVCVDRDPKGLYKKASKGEIPNFTGIGQGYETPKNPDLHLKGDADLDENVRTILGEII
jgi:bifunctional enzyme CysN/CysC